MPDAAPLVRNPVLPGFHPDPSFVRVGDDYYLATSTFEWFPGVALHHSRDLVHWRPVGHALTRPSQLDLRGVASSAGSWAPSLSHADGLFWLIYTNVRTSAAGRPFKDAHTYLVTAPAIEGPWSEPVYLNAIGFDPSLFHDDDGRKWLVNMQWDHRPGRYRFAGIVLQQYDPAARRLTGPVHEILRKPNILCEGPNLYKHAGRYYLMLAEGGTGWGHGISLARADHLTGPYELDPAEALLTTRHHPAHPLQKAGHGELLQDTAGDWWLAHLASRPVALDPAACAPPLDNSPAARAHHGHRCILGRETCLQRLRWDASGWPRLAHGDALPALEVAPPASTPPHPWPAPPARDDFDAPVLSPRWQTLRVPADPSWLSLDARPGWLRLTGRESPSSLHEQSLVARRLPALRCSARTRLEYSPNRYTQMAGLVCWYDEGTFFYLRVTHHETLGKILSLALCDEGRYDEPADTVFPVADWPQLHLRADFDHASLRFFASPDGADWHPVPGDYDASKLSDDYGTRLRFTGAMVGLACHDVAGQRSAADFDYFELL